MKILGTIKYLSALGLVFGFAFNANAGLIDFRSADWTGANGQQTFAANGVTASAAPWYAKLSQNSTDGLGIDGWLDEPDEIDGLERLTLDFGTATLVEEITISNLYADEEYCFIFCFKYDETGYYKKDNSGSWIGFTGVDAINGLFTISLNETVQLLDFKSDEHEFSVQQIKTASVPEPGTLALLSLGLAGLTFARKRK